MISINIFRYFTCVILMLFCTSVSATEEDFSSFMIERAGGYVGWQNYYMARKNNDWLLTVFSEVPSGGQKEYEVNIYDLRKGDLAYSYTYLGVGGGRIDEALSYFKERGYHAVPNIKRKRPGIDEKIRDDGRKYIKTGDFRILSNEVDACNSSLDNTLSIWDKEGGNRIGKYVIVVKGNFERAGWNSCYKMFGNESEKLRYMTLKIDMAWGLGDDMYAVSFKNIPGLTLLARDGSFHFSSIDSIMVSQIEYNEYKDFYEKYRKVCALPTDQNEITLDECISAKYDGDIDFGELFNKNIKGNLVNEK